MSFTDAPSGSSRASRAASVALAAAIRVAFGRCAASHGSASGIASGAA